METPLDFGVFRQTVTVYRLQDGQVRRLVTRRGHLQMQQELTKDRDGCRQERKFMLVWPGDDGELFPGDRVYAGEGPEVTGAQWEDFIPVNVPGLLEIRYVKPYYWRDVLCLTEAGR